MDNNIFKDKRKRNILIILCTFLWGSAFPVLKISYRELGLSSMDIYEKMVFAGIRFFLASLIAMVFYKAFTKSRDKLSKGQWYWIILLGVFNTTLQYFFFYNGLANTSGVKGSILASSGTFFVIIFAHFIFKNDKISSFKIIGLILGFLGIYFSNINAISFDNVDFRFVFMGEVILSGITSAISAIIAKNLSSEVHPFRYNSFQMMIGSLLLMLIGYVGNGYSLKFTPLSIVLLIYSAFLSAVAFSLWYMLIKYNRVSEISIYKFLIPVFGSILTSIFIPQEGFNIFIILALIMVSLGIYIVNREYK